MPQDKQPKKNITGSYPGVTGTYKRPGSSQPEIKQAPPKIEKVKAQSAPKKQASGFDFKAWFSSDNMKAFLKHLRYYGAIVVAALLLSALIINVSNDVFAFIRPDESIVVNIPQGSSTLKIATILSKNKVIDHPLVFMLYSKLKKADGQFQYGDYSLNSNLGYDLIISKLRKASVQAQTVTFTIPEGSTQDKVVEILTSKRYLSASDLETALNEYEYKDYDFVSKIPDRRCRLEGYILAGDYEMSVGESAVSVVEKMLERFKTTVLTEQNQKLIKSRGLTVDEVVTFASLIQAECDNADDFKTVASVIYNRLNGTPDKNLALTAPIKYVLATDKATLDKEDKLTDSKYNTYVHKGLTPGPVCFVSEAAIEAVLSPESSAYMYFVSDGEKTYFSKTEDEHNKTLKKVNGAKGTDTVK